MPIICELLTVSKYRLICLKNFLKKYYIYFLILLFVAPLLATHIKGLFNVFINVAPIERYKHILEDKFLLGGFSVKLFFILIIASMFDISAALIAEGSYNNYFFFPISAVTYNILKVIKYFFNNLFFNFIIIVSLFVFAAPSNVLEFMVVSLAILIYRLIFNIWILLLYKKIKNHINPVVFIMLIAMPVLFFLASLMQMSPCDHWLLSQNKYSFGYVLSSAIPTEWLIRLIYGMKFMRYDIMFYNLGLIILISLASIYASKRFLTKKTPFDGLKIKTPQPQTVIHDIAKPAIVSRCRSLIKALILREAVQYKWSAIMICMMLIFSLAANYVSRDASMISVYALALFIYMDYLIAIEWKQIYYLKSYPVSFETIYWVKVVISFVIKTVMFLFLTLSNYVFFEKIDTSVNWTLFIILTSFSCIWVSQFYLDLSLYNFNYNITGNEERVTESYVISSNQSCDTSVPPPLFFYNSINTYYFILKFITAMLFGSACFYFWNYKLYIDFFIMALAIAEIHFAVHKKAFRRFKNGVV